MKIIPATPEDIPELVTLLQDSFRGKKGWCRDTHLLEGTRVTPEMLHKDMSNPEGLLLKCVSEDVSVILGCIYTVKNLQSNALFTGTICVHPDYQSRGIGNMLLKAVEERARALKCSAISLDVILSRAELVSWYQRQGYRVLEGTRPFPEGPYGKFKVPPEVLALATMQKDL